MLMAVLINPVIITSWTKERAIQGYKDIDSFKKFNMDMDNGKVKVYTDL